MTGGLARTDNLLQFCILLFPTCVASLLPACMFLNCLEKDKGKAMISSYFLIQFYVCIRVFCSYVCLCTIQGQKNVSDPMGLELQKVVSLHAGAGNQNGSSGRVARALKPRHLIPDILS